MEENGVHPASDIALNHRVEVATAVVPRSYGTDLQTCRVVLWIVIIILLKWDTLRDVSLEKAVVSLIRAPPKYNIVLSGWAGLGLLQELGLFLQSIFSRVDILLRQ